jgi:hypothetical protein
MQAVGSPFGASNLEFVSDFEIRISDLGHGKRCAMEFAACPAV